MSSRGRGSGRNNAYRGGRGSGRGSNTRSSYRSSHNQDKKKTSTSSQSTTTAELKFAPHTPGKPQKVTYDSLRDQILLQIQKSYKNGQDIADALRLNVDAEPGTKPTRVMVTIEASDVASEEKKMMKQMEQAGNDLEYKEHLRMYNSRVEVYKENRVKAYALIFGYCNKTMQHRIEETGYFETTIRNDPFKLLEEIKTKMYDPARAKYEYISLTETLSRIINDSKQEEDETLIEYTKRFKQTRDIVKNALGSEFLDSFADRTKEVQEESDATRKDELKKKAFDKWTTYLYLKNSDYRKYGSLMKGFRTQYSLGNNQYPKSLTAAADVLTNHP